MIDKLEAGKTYRLIEKEGYFESYHNNKTLFNTYFNDNCITIDSVDSWGDGLSDKCTDWCIITNDEFAYFELVPEHSSLPNYTPCNTLTCCQELAAEYNDSRFTVEYKQQVLESLIQLLTTGETK